MKSLLSKVTLASFKSERGIAFTADNAIFLSSRTIVRSLFYIACGFFIIHIIGVLVVFGYGINGPIATKVYAKINMNKEFGIPTIYSFVILLFASMLLYLVSNSQKQKQVKDWIYWRLLSVVFLYLSVDEALSIHEKFSVIKKYLPSGESWFIRRAWIFPYSVGVLVLGIIFLKFLFRLPKKTRKLFVIAGIFYCVAAIGFELPESYFGVVVGNTMFVHLTNGLEEFMEMASIILFIHAIFDFMCRSHVRISFWPFSKKPR